MITGANRGIGLEMTRQSAAIGNEVIACCCTPMEAAAHMALARETDRVSILGSDVRIERDMKPIAAGLGRKLDLLVCNAGVLKGRGGVLTPNRTVAPSKTRLSTMLPAGQCVVGWDDSFASHLAEHGIECVRNEPIRHMTKDAIGAWLIELRQG